MRSALTFFVPFLKKEKGGAYITVIVWSWEKDERTILLSPPVVHREEGGRREDIGLSIFVDVSAAQAGHFWVAGSGFPFVPSVERLSVLVQ